MRSITLRGNTWEVYENLRKKEPEIHKRLCKILKEMQRDNPAEGIGKPEKLKHNLTGLWSRRLSKKDRLIYSFDKDSIEIFAIGGHYDQK